MEKICAVVVTFNRLTLLKETIEGLKNQSISLDKIIIVDNDSTDGTRDWLSSIKSDKIELIFQDNVGGAGGFHTGVKAGYEQGYDWIWMMDDDVIPNTNCLEELLNYREVSSCLNPMKQYIDGSPMYWARWYDALRGVIYTNNNILFENGNKVTFVNVGNFEGMLVSRELVSQIGFPNPDYFIAHDDTDYGFRASFYTNVAYVRDAILVRNMKITDYKLSAFYLYYNYRNQFILFRESLKIPFDYYGVSKFHYYKGIFQRAWSETKSLLKKQDDQKKLKVKSIWRGIIDGLKGKVGKTF